MYRERSKYCDTNYPNFNFWGKWNMYFIQIKWKRFCTWTFHWKYPGRSINLILINNVKRTFKILWYHLSEFSLMYNPIIDLFLLKIYKIDATFLQHWLMCVCLFFMFHPFWNIRTLKEEIFVERNFRDFGQIRECFFSREQKYEKL